MPTITITLTGSALTGLTSNPSKAYTISDADLQLLLNWAQAMNVLTLPASPTNPQILLAWIQMWINESKSGIQQKQTQTIVPAPISIA